MPAARGCDLSEVYGGGCCEMRNGAAQSQDAMHDQGHHKHMKMRTGRAKSRHAKYDEDEIGEYFASGGEMNIQRIYLYLLKKSAILNAMQFIVILVLIAILIRRA